MSTNSEDIENLILQRLRLIDSYYTPDEKIVETFKLIRMELSKVATLVDSRISTYKHDPSRRIAFLDKIKEASNIACESLLLVLDSATSKSKEE